MEKLTSNYVVPGRILWLPAKDELPRNAIRAIKGSRCLAEFGYETPVVVISRPADDGDVAHFHCVSGNEQMSK
jgi:hypothetical protein